MTPPVEWTLSRRRSIGMLAAAGLVLGGCNVRPLYGSSADGTTESVAAALASVQVRPIADRSGQLLRGFLVQALSPNGRAENPVYILTVTLRETERSLGIAVDDTATRGNVLIRSNSTLKEVATDRDVWSDSRTVITSFGILDEQFATIIGERSARERALRQTAQEIRTAMALLFQRGIPAPEPETEAPEAAPR